MKTCGIVLTYNRKFLLLQNIKSLQAQTRKLDLIIVIDNNSTDNTRLFLADNNVLDSISYVYLNENIGSAGGFSLGIQKALSLGYDWVLLMDDDGRPQNNECFKKLFDYIEQKNISPDQPFFINSLVVCDNTNLSFPLAKKIRTIKDANTSKYCIDGIIMNYASPFNGTLISKGLIHKIGLPNEKFYVKYVENDYKARAAKNKVPIITICSSLYYHPSAKISKVLHLFKKDFTICIDNPLNEYYNTRNTTYSIIQNSCTIRKGKRQARKNKLKKLLTSLISPCKKIETIKMICLGYNDGLKGKLGKFDEKKQH
jgi:rhamnopyranosyl-N-acetylglucosaminyl-diphospho-decaprenol beta-1,3/1,4-galactofuranosyltransferase